jgi:hypothetical protein
VPVGSVSSCYLFGLTFFGSDLLEMIVIATLWTDGLVEKGGSGLLLNMPRDIRGTTPRIDGYVHDDTPSG